MNSLEKQQQNVNELLQLVKENPELEIIPMVATDCVLDDNFSHWMAEWGKAEVDGYYCLDERIYFKNKDFESLVENFIEEEYRIYKYSQLTNEQLENFAKERANNVEWTKAIVVYIDTI